MKHKMLGYIVFAFVLFMIVKNPVGSAGTAQHLGTALATTASAVGDFLGTLLGGGHR